MNITKILFSFWCLFSVTLFFHSCEENNRKKEIAQIVKEWQGKEIIFPENTLFTIYGQDTLHYQMPESDYKILLYVDSVGCTSCKLQLHKWKEFTATVDSLTNNSVPVLFFFHPKDKKELIYLLKRDEITNAVCIDENDSLNKINHFPSQQDLQSYLLDKDNKVVYIGNPVHNTQIRNIYSDVSQLKMKLIIRG